MWKQWAWVGMIAVLQGCGGGGQELAASISEAKAQSLQFGKTAVIQIAGKYLRNDLAVESGTCTNPVFSASSTPDLAILNCKVTSVGPLPITIRAANGEVLLSTTFTVVNPEVTMVTGKGNIVLELDPQRAPISVDNFLGYVSRGYYASTLFHRVIPGFVIQAGGFTTGMVKKDTGLQAPIALESNNGLFNTRGTVAMARTAAPASATSQFFFNLVDNAFLNYQGAASPGYAVFGRVVQGLDVMDAIAAVPTGASNGFTDVPLSDVTITTVAQTR